MPRVQNFDEWRDAARPHLLLHTRPSSLVWQDGDDRQEALFAPEAAPPQPVRGNQTIRLPRAFVEQAKVAALHRDSNRWTLLYRLAWRLQNENPNLLHIETDYDVYTLAAMAKSVDHDIHKMRAFVRFRCVSDHHIAWYQPDHHILDANAPFFIERFRNMHWSILTPDGSITWNLERLENGPGVPRSQAPSDDEYEDLWRTYYAAIYNPARRNATAMRAQLPVRRWIDLPESRTISALMRESPARVEAMARVQPTSASAFIPPHADLAALRAAVPQCRACELCARATQPVFGEGPTTARILLVGEQPGDEEDRTGHPFAGPAGQVLNAAMQQAGVDRSSVYVTNAVKAFRFEQRGKLRIHQTPRASHVAACRPWLEAEIESVGPRMIVCLGATAAHAILGRTVSIQAERAAAKQQRYGAEVTVTYHPSAILRSPDEATRQRFHQALLEDLAKLA